MKFLVLIALCSLLAAGQSSADSGEMHLHDHHHNHNADEEAGKIISPMPSGAANSKLPAQRPTRQAAIQIVDLSYPLNNNTLHWVSNSGFQYKVDKDGTFLDSQKKAYYLKSDSFTIAVHTGTHLDAPRHFGQDSWTVDQIPLDRLINVPLTVIDLSAKVAANRSYSFTMDDFYDFQSKQPLVSKGSVVLVYTGISEFYKAGEKEYFGFASNARNITEMRIPGFTREAAQFIAELGLYGVGLDAPSADSSQAHGPNDTYNPGAHTIFNTHNLYILENVSDRLKELVKVPAGTMRLTIAPLAIEGGSGSPVRLVATIGHQEYACLRNSAAGFSLSCSYLSLIAPLMFILTNWLMRRDT